MAAEQCKHVFPIFIFTPEQITVKNKFKSDNAVQFMIESLDDLSENIRMHKGKLNCFYGDNDSIIKKLIKKWNIDYIYIDSAAQQTRFDFAQNYDITTINAKKSVLDGIGAVAGIVDNDQLFVHQSCKETLLCLDQYQWDPNPNLLKEKPKHNYASHMADALRYALYSFETSATTF